MTAAIPAPRAICGRLAMVFAALAVVAPVVVVLVFVGTEQQRPDPPQSGPRAYEAWGWLGRVIVTFALAAISAGVLAVGGVISAIVAVGRGERPAWPAWFGLCVCAPIVVLLLVAVVNGQH
jgi:hypothetical protein